MLNPSRVWFKPKENVMQVLNSEFLFGISLLQFGGSRNLPAICSVNPYNSIFTQANFPLEYFFFQMSDNVKEIQVEEMERKTL